MSSITPDELMTLRRDPEALEREIARYSQIRDDAESKLRAVVDEVTARELRELAERELHSARLEVEKAQAQARDLVDGAEATAANIRQQANAESKSVLEAANLEANTLRMEHAALLLEARDLKTELENRISAAMAAKAVADAAQERALEAAKASDQETARLSSIRQRLEPLVGEINGVLREIG